MRTELAPYPVGPTGKDAVPVTASVTGTTAATAATLPAGGANFQTFISGFEVTGGATAAASVTVVVSGTVSGSLNYNMTYGTLPQNGSLIVEFNPPIPASALNTAIVVTAGAAGAGGVVAVTTHGFQLPFSS